MIGPRLTEPGEVVPGMWAHIRYHKRQLPRCKACENVKTAPKV